MNRSILVIILAGLISYKCFAASTIVTKIDNSKCIFANYTNMTDINGNTFTVSNGNRIFVMSDAIMRRDSLQKTVNSLTNDIMTCNQAE